MLRNYGDLDSNYSYSGSSRAGFSGQENVGSRDRDTQITVKNLSDLVSDTFLQSRWINFSEGYNQQSSMLQPIGGMDKIATAFRGRVASNITYGAVVKEIRKVSLSLIHI